MEELAPAYTNICKWLDDRNKEYRDGNPTVSDHEWDMVFRALQYLEKAFPAIVSPYSPTQKVG